MTRIANGEGRLAGTVARGSLLGMVGQAWHLVTAFALYAYLARALGPSLFGQWTVVLSVLSWVEIVVASGLVKVVTKSLAEKPGKVAHFARVAYVGQVLVSLVAFAALVVAAGPVAAALGDPTLAPLVRIAALDVPLYAVFMASSAVVLGRQRYARQGLAWIVYASAKALFIAGFVWAGYGVAGALVGNALSSLAGLAAMYVRAARPGTSAGELLPTLRWMLVAAVPFLLLSLVQGLAQYVDLWIVSALVPSDEMVGFYAAATVLAEIPVFLFLGLNRVIFPSISSAQASGESARADSYATQSLRTAVIVTVLAVGFVAAAGPQVISIVFSERFARAYLPVVLLMAAGAGRTVHATCAEILMARDRRPSALVLLVGIVVAELVAVTWATAMGGIDLAAAAAAASMLAGAAVGVALLRSAVGWRPALTLARSVLAAVVVCGVIAALRLPPSGVVALLPVVAVAYGGLLWLLREFDSDDVTAMRAALGR